MNFDVEKFKISAHKPIIIGLCIFVVAATAISDMPPYLNGVASQNWPETSGIIKSVEVKPYKLGDASGFHNKVVYIYKVQNRVYFGNRIRFQKKKTYDGLETSEFEKDYVVGKHLRIFYNPDNPKLCCLKPGATISLVFSQIVIYIILSLIIYLTLYPRLETIKASEPEGQKVASSS